MLGEGSLKLGSVGLNLIAVLLITSGVALANTRQIGFDERVRAQEAIERVYYSHQIAAADPFEDAVPRGVLDGKVRTYLQQSAALEKFWNTTISAEALQGELERIVRDTRFSDRLERLFGALGNDSVLIQETFVRQVLAERLSRSFFGADRRIHQPARLRAERLREALLASERPSLADAPQPEVYEVRVGRSRSFDSSRPGAPTVIELEDDKFSRWRSSVPESSGEVGAVVEGQDGFTLRVTQSAGADSVQLLTYRIPKISWEAWWEKAAKQWSWRDPGTAARPAPLGPFSASNWQPGDQRASGSCDPESAWTRSLADLPDPHTDHTAVWTGTLMLVWGGWFPGSPYMNTGNRYDPLTDTWTTISTAGAPAGRHRHSAVWTGTEMIIWGGVLGDFTSVGTDTGARYNPQTDTWQPVTTVGAPSGRQGHAAVWTGTELVVWSGGSATIDGGRYDPATDTWSPMSTSGTPEGRFLSTAVWTGSEMIVWGGISSVFLNSGGRYDPVADAWSPMSTPADLAGRTEHTAVWTGDRMIVWGGGSSVTFNTGGSYDPATDTWTPTTTVNAPPSRQDHTAVWTGERMVVWGGTGSNGHIGGQYDPESDSWMPLTTVNVPAGRSGHTAVWTGELMVVWGGRTNTGGRYDPLTDSWTPTRTAGSPTWRYDHTAVWTGNQMGVDLLFTRKQWSYVHCERPR